MTLLTGFTLLSWSLTWNRRWWCPPILSLLFFVHHPFSYSLLSSKPTTLNFPSFILYFHWHIYIWILLNLSRTVWLFCSKPLSGFSCPSDESYHLAVTYKARKSAIYCLLYSPLSAHSLTFLLLLSYLLCSLASLLFLKRQSMLLSKGLCISCSPAWNFLPSYACVVSHFLQASVHISERLFLAI